MSTLSLSQRALAIELEISPQTVNNQLTGKSPISFDIVYGMLCKYDCISAEWLLRGKGEMYIGDVIDNTNYQSVGDNNSHVYQNHDGTQLIGVDKSLEERVKDLEDERKRLNDHILRQEKFIDQLMKK